MGRCRPWGHADGVQLHENSDADGDQERQGEDFEGGVLHDEITDGTGKGQDGHNCRNRISHPDTRSRSLLIVFLYVKLRKAFHLSPCRF